ncbi:hypothetical protein [Peribacillus frigoritolerans]|uniref:hypothetical protein n=1 Tax=Peribacillus frigoritolerans TaxID=450367 RepID=UPI002EB64972|nr:hypothetical protein [Peribacillus frigoritolerans]
MNSSVSEDFELVPHEIGANIRELEALLVNQSHLLVNLEQILVKLIVTEDFKLFPQENGAEIRELGTLLVN